MAKAKDENGGAPAPELNVPQGLTDAFHKTLNEHGYGFHYAVERHIRDLATKGAVPWHVEQTEFPVSFHGATNIDIVLRQLRYRQHEPIRIAGECKRANPSLVDWCFVRTPLHPLVTSNARSVAIERIRVRYVDGDDADGYRSKVPLVSHVGLNLDSAWESDRVYNLAFPMKGNEKGDQHGEDRDKTLARAVDQALRGAAGLSQFLSNEPHLLARTDDGAAAGAVLPVVFTTAKLLVSDVELSASELRTGNVVRGSLKPIDWLWLKQNVSSELRWEFKVPFSSRREPWSALSQYVMKDYARCVGIVSVPGIEAFLSHNKLHI